MLEISRIICLCILTVLSAADIKVKRVPFVVCIVSTAGALIYQGIGRDTSLWEIVFGAGVGGLFFLVSKVTGEGIGYGDSWIILALGLYLGVWQVLSVLLGAFLLLLPVGMCCFVRLKMTRKIKAARSCTLPFLPFLTGGYILLLLRMVSRW